MKNTVFISLLVLVLFSCKKNVPEPSVYDFELVKTSKIILNPEDRNRSNIQFAETDNGNILVISCGNKLVFYNIETAEKENEIILKDYINYFSFINEDSIFIYSEGSIKKRDENLQLIDYYGNIMKKYKYNIDTLELQRRNLNIEECFPPTVIRNHQKGLTYADGNVFFSTYYKKVGDVGTEEFMQNRLPMIMAYNTKDNIFKISRHNSFPYVEEGIYYPTLFTVKSACISGNNTPLLRFLYSSNLFEWDYKNDEIITHPLKSMFIDTVMPLPEPNDYNSDGLGAVYHNTCYDKFNKLYFSYTLFFAEIFGDDITGSIIIADKDFNYLGEIYNHFYYPYDFSKDYMIDYYPINDSLIEVYYLKLKKTNRNFDMYVDSCKNDLKIRKQKTAENSYADLLGEDYVVDFLKIKKDIKENSYTVLTVYDSGCLGCNNFLLNELENNQKEYEESPFYLIVSAATTDQIDRFLKDNEKIRNFTNIIIDSAGIINKMTKINNLKNPRLTIVRENKVIMDSIYDSFHIASDLYPTLRESLNLKD